MASNNTSHPLPELFPGAKYRASAQASVDAILGPQGIRRPVLSMGNEFKNADSWTGIDFSKQFVNWCAQHPGTVPNHKEVQGMIVRANQYRNDTPQIFLARTPDKLNRRTQLALVGGGYHEAWHTQYSKRDQIQFDEVWGITQRVGEIVNHGGKFDGKLADMLDRFCAIIEDVRIERLGCKEYPGVKVPLHDLQDFILDLEKRGRQEAAKIRNVDDVDNARGVLLSVFRDYGLGYNTNAGREAIDSYKKTSPEAVAMCLPGGLLHPHLQASKAITGDDKMGYLRVAMECVISLWKATQIEDKGDETPDLNCPNCGASASNLVIRPAKDPQGRKVRGKAELECKICGFKDEIPMPDASLSLNQQEQEDNKHEMPEFEDMPPKESDGEGDNEKDSDPKPNKSKSKSKKDQGDKSKKDQGDKSKKDQGDKSKGDGDEGDEDQNGSEGEGSEGDDGEGDDGDGGDGDGGDGDEGEGKGGDGDGDDGEGSDGDDGEGDGGDGDGEDGEGDGGDGDGDGNQQSDGGTGNNGEKQQESGVDGAGGHQYAGQDPEAVSQTASDILGSEDSKDPLNSGSALTIAFEAENDKNNRDLQHGERPWCPYNPGADEARVVRSAQVESDRASANKMLGEVKVEVAMLRARLRSIVRAQEMTDIEHGLRRGKRISERMLVDSKLSLMDGHAPRRAYQDKEDTLDTSLSLAICLDQSGSMHGMRRQVAKAMIVLTEPVEAIGGKVLAFGFRDGNYYPDNYGYSYSDQNYHRIPGVHYDVFKHWDERFANVKWRFAHTQATGGTPMADGVQFGLTALNSRNEAHRILAVITDGYPNSPHEQVIAGQVRRAQEVGIHVIGIGIGQEAKYVKTLFPDSVHVNSVSDLPKMLISKLNEVCDFGGKFRGKRMKLDNRMVKRVS